MMLTAATMGLAGQDVTVAAPVAGETAYRSEDATASPSGYSVPAVVVYGNVYGFDDFAQAVARANVENAARGAA
jgi:dienelactone hydrolase